MPIIERRIILLFFLIFFVVMLFWGRLAYLQIYKGRQLTAAAVGERTLSLPIGNFMRGDIVDCNEKSLLDTYVAYTVAVFPMLVDFAGQETKLSREAEENEVVLEIRKQLGGKKEPFILPVSLSEREAETLKKLNLSGVFVLPYLERYGELSLSPHLVGCVGGNLLKGEALNGIKGIEGFYDSFLQPSNELLELVALVDAQGNFIQEGDIRLRGNAFLPEQKKNVVLTIDKRIQEVVEGVLDNFKLKGAVAVVDVSDGTVKAIASRPVYDQKAGAGEQFDRSLALYHPGSIFKIVVAAAALAEGKVTPEEIFNCTGEYRFNEGEKISCWKTEGHGRLSFRKAFASSCNTVFVEVALRVGGEKLEEYARKLGLEEGLTDYPYKKGGSFNIGAYPGQVGNSALGQEGVLLSPLNAAVLAATIARGGIYLPPRVVCRIEEANGKIVESFLSPSPKRVLQPEIAQELQNMLSLAVVEGTGKNADVPGPGCAGKTGSAENGSQESGDAQQTNAWFVGYAPRKDSQVAVAVFIENGGAGGDVAAQVFKEIIEGLLTGDFS